MIPQIDNSLSNNVIELVSYPNKTYKITETQTAGIVNNLEAIEQTVYHILSVERYAYLIYDDDYGVELEKYIGQSYEYLEGTIEETLREALLQDDRILNVEVTDISQSVQQQQMIDKTKIYSSITEEDNDELITETNDNNLITDRTITDVLSISYAKVVNVKFNVICKQGVIEAEVKVNV